MSVHIEVRPSFSLSSYVFIRLHWVLVAHSGSSLYHMRSFSCDGQALEHTGYAGFITPLHVGSNFPDRGSNLHLLHCREDSQWLNHPPGKPPEVPHSYSFWVFQCLGIQLFIKSVTLWLVWCDFQLWLLQAVCSGSLCSCLLLQILTGPPSCPSYWLNHLKLHYV